MRLSVFTNTQDLQVCRIEMVLGKSDTKRVRLDAGELLMEQEADMNLFYITEHRLVNTDWSNTKLRH